jgi:hypothetical protein
MGGDLIQKDITRQRFSAWVKTVEVFAKGFYLNITRGEIDS